MLRSGAPSGTEITEIVNSRAVDNALDATRARHRFELRVQLVFAEETTIGIICAVAGIFQLFGLDHFMLKPKLLNHAVDLRALVFRQARRLPGDADRAWSEFRVRDISDITAIDAA